VTVVGSDMAEWLILVTVVLLGGFVCYRLEAIHCEMVSIREMLREAGVPIDEPGAR
jgi:hypothetical protein